MSDTMPERAYVGFRRMIDDVVLLAVAAKEDEPLSEFLGREVEDALSRLAERDLITKEAGE